MKFGDLVPGDVVTLMNTRSVVLAVQSPHPLNPGFSLIIFYVWDEARGRTSFDMLDPNYNLIPGTKVSKDGMQTYRAAMEAMRNAPY